MLVYRFPSTVSEIVLAVAWFSLAWFVMGLLAGRRLVSAGASRPRAAGGARKPRKGQAVEIYVGNLSYDMTEKHVAGLFESYGKVQDVRVIQHKLSGRSKGFGFVEMSDRAEAEAAIRALNGKEIQGRKIVCNEARSRGRG
jgi:RNA recognition motif-containing protein